MSDELVEVEIFGEKTRVTRSFAENQGLPFKTKGVRKAWRLNWGLFVSGVIVAVPFLNSI